VKRALAVVSEEEFDRQFAPVTAQKIREAYAKVKEEFKQSVSWDIDFSSMVEKVGAPYKQYYIAAYKIPNFQIHATLASALPDHRTEEQTAERNRDSGALALAAATLIFLNVLRSQDQLFSLNFGAEIDACENTMGDVWQKSEPWR